MPRINGLRVDGNVFGTIGLLRKRQMILIVTGSCRLGGDFLHGSVCLFLVYKHNSAFNQVKSFDTRLGSVDIDGVHDCLALPKSGSLSETLSSAVPFCVLFWLLSFSLLNYGSRHMQRAEDDCTIVYDGIAGDATILKL